MSSTITTKNEKETIKFSKVFAEKLHAGDIVFLYGNLGSGKTTLVKGVAEALGITSRIISPTFILVRKHEVPYSSSGVKRSREVTKEISSQGRKIKTLYHLDLYRLEDDKEIDNIGLKDIVEDKEAVTFIEWPEKIENNISAQWVIQFEHRNDTRVITVTKN